MKAWDIMTFGEEAVRNTVSRLLSGYDYREIIVHAIDKLFFDFFVKFFREIVYAKFDGGNINMAWYIEHFIDGDNVSPDDAVIYAGLNRKTITNIYGTSARKIMLDTSKNNLESLSAVINEIEKNSEDDFALSTKITHNDITVELSLTESLLVINALAAKKLQIIGGAWSAIGKRVEKPLVDELCRRAGVPEEFIDRKNFRRDKNLPYDRETDYRLKSITGKVYRVEVKLMDRGNPESADVTIARDTDIFIADTLSGQAQSQLKERGTEYLTLRDNDRIIPDFTEILDRLRIPRRH